MASLATYYKDGAQYYPVGPFYDPGIGQNVHDPGYLSRYQHNVRGTKLKKASFSDPSLSYYDVGYFPVMPSPTNHANGAYERNPMNGAEYNNGDPVYDSQYFQNRQDLANDWGCQLENNPRNESYDLNDNFENFRKQSKSKDRSRRRLSFNGDLGAISQPAYDKASDQWPVSYDTKEVYASPVSSSSYYSGSRDDHTISQTSIRSDSMQGRWQQWPWVPQNLYRSSALSPSSPLDSGLSSQSIASSPSIEQEETMPTRNYDYEKIPSHQRSRRETRQCSCPSNLYPDPHGAHAHQWKTDSGRSSPWATVPMHHCILFPSQQSQNTNVQPYDHRVVPQNSQYDRGRGQFLEPGIHEHRYKKIDDEYRPLLLSYPTHGSYSSEDASESTLKESQTVQHTTNSQTAKDSSKQTHVPARLVKVSPLPDLSIDPPASNQKCRKVKKENMKNAELAICELEEIYKNLNLDDFDLLDRAERRDLPTAHQNFRELQTPRSHALTRSKSDSFYEIFGQDYDTGYPKSPRAPPMRRSGVPDRIADDMALRKQQKAVSKSKKMVGNSSYMLCSAHFTPGIPPGVNEFPMMSRPDVEYDDLSYRKYFTQYKVERPHPPFGIPVKPVIPSSFSDYLHATPSNVPQALCHPRGNPDVVRDDMAYRTLRRDVL